MPQDTIIQRVVNDHIEVKASAFAEIANMRGVHAFYAAKNVRNYFKCYLTSKAGLVSRQDDAAIIS